MSRKDYTDTKISTFEKRYGIPKGVLRLKHSIQNPEVFASVNITFKYFAITTKITDTEKFIDELEILCRKYATPKTAYNFQFEGD
jgi:hypothetical protein